MKSRSPDRRSCRPPTRLPLAVAIAIACVPVAHAQDATAPAPQQASESQKKNQAGDLGQVIVTAQKRSENMQKVPISIQVLGQQKLEELHVNKFEDYAKLLPSVSFQNDGPGFDKPYMRGVVSGDNANHSGSLPSVGVYLDEEPITTITGPLDIHIYDVARIEALAGPQGTLYGASSESGTLRIITNKPDPSAFQAGFGLEVNTVHGGGLGNVKEGFVNIPLGKRAAVRLVAWDKTDAGFINNVHQTRTYPSSGLTSDNAELVRNRYNDSHSTGARAALKIDLDDGWSITPGIMGQTQKTNGQFAFDPAIGDLKVGHFKPEWTKDRWWQAALTVQGKIGNFDLTYAYAHLKRTVDTASDYNDYSFWYDTLFGSGTAWVDNNGAMVNPSQYIQARDGYGKTSHELRLASPVENRFRVVGGLFVQTQTHNIFQDYRIDGLADNLSVGGWPGTIWLTRQQRRDHDEAVFGEASFDITKSLTITGGIRHYRAHNSLEGFFGYGLGYSSNPEKGEAKCQLLYGPDRSKWPGFNGAPCSDFNKSVSESGNLGRANLTYHFDKDKMVYATWSQGYRPGGINRRAVSDEHAFYLADTLTNYELGWKTTWLNNRLRFNGAVFSQRWKDFQFSFLGLNGLTEIRNANQAQIDGTEMDLTWAATYNLTLTGSIGAYKPRLTQNYCSLDASGNVRTNCSGADLLAPKGAALPFAPKFKGNLVARYAFNLASYNAYVQGVVAHVGERRSDLRTFENGIKGNMAAYTTFDLSTGFGTDKWNVELYASNLTDSRGITKRGLECLEAVCGANPTVAGSVYSTPIRPRTVGIRYRRDF
ncbi:TonB-dependent receptor [Solilutibacter silvestris]|uniref:TonB dependent receptor n=1 Tax=Solilutibacter silvestris TaxID=1645665 RepID=A0A2K1Q3Q8_9GAMM|nr:TonB-dependent receptor [Lysobacter silvestris]PNS09685.1 TonB dependent receptor [Lysobacter silvestris]